MYNDLLCTVCAVTLYLLVYLDSLGNHSLNGGYKFLAVVHVYMRFGLARSICRNFHSEVVVQAQRAVVGIVEADSNNRGRVVGIDTHNGRVNGVTSYSRLGFYAIDAYRICTVQKSFATAEHIARIDRNTLGVTVAYGCFAQLLPLAIVEHFHYGKDR